jgi:hypothetical protein
MMSKPCSPPLSGLGKRDPLVAAPARRRIETVVNFRAIHLLTNGDFPCAERIGGETLSLPFHTAMPFEFLNIVTGALADIRH